MVKLATLTFMVDEDDLVALDEEGFEVGRTTVASGLLEAEHLWHFVYNAARESSERG